MKILGCACVHMCGKEYTMKVRGKAGKERKASGRTMGTEDNLAHLSAGHSSHRLTVTTKLKGVPLANSRVLSTSLGLVVPVTLTLTPALLTSRGKTPALPPLVNCLSDPVNPGIPPHSLVLRVNSDNLKVLVDTVLVDPVRVKDTEVGALATDTLLSSSAERTLVLEVVNTLADGLAVGGTLGHGLLAVTATNADAVDDVTLLGLVAETVGLVKTRRARSAVDHVELTVLPASVCVESRKGE